MRELLEVIYTLMQEMSQTTLWQSETVILILAEEMPFLYIYKEDTYAKQYMW